MGAGGAYGPYWDMTPLMPDIQPSGGLSVPMPEPIYGLPTFSAQRGGVHWSDLKTTKKRKLEKLTKKQKRKQAERQQRARLMRIITLEAAMKSLVNEVKELRQLISRDPGEGS